MTAIAAVEAFPIRLPRALDVATGTAGSPTALGGPAGSYRWSETVHALYSEYIETTIVRVTLENGSQGWGEAQAPLAPRVAATIVGDLLAPAIVGAAFEASRAGIAALWQCMYQTMRVRGQTGGFMLDAISGVDLALWDLAGKQHNRPVCSLIGAARSNVAAYLSGLPAGDVAGRAAIGRQKRQEGFRVVKIFHDADEESTLALVDALRAEGVSVALDALWRLSLPESRPFLRAIERRELRWLECPFPPDEIAPHREMAQAFRIALALGESYRTRYELAPFLELDTLAVVQPDLGRSGITETLRVADAVRGRRLEVIPHVSIALGPQLAAAIHTAAALPGCTLCEYNPAVFDVCNRYLVEPLRFAAGEYRVPDSPGLGIEIRWDDLMRDNLENRR